MDELIDRAEFIKSQCGSCDGWCNNTRCDCLECKSEHRCEFILALVDEPTIDAVEVVRCKDCKWYEQMLYSTSFRCCRIGGMEEAKADGFCSYGERREEADGKTICGTGSL